MRFKDLGIGFHIMTNLMFCNSLSKQAATILTPEMHRSIDQSLEYADVLYLSVGQNSFDTYYS